MVSQSSLNLFTGIISGIVSGVLVGAILYNLYNVDPLLYVSCEKNLNILKVEIENSGQPAMDAWICLKSQDGWCFLPAEIKKIGKENAKLEIDMSDLKKTKSSITNSSLSLSLNCQNCNSQKIHYSGCSYLE